MVTSSELMQRARKMRWPRLLELWKQIDQGAILDWPSGSALEHLVIRAFELDGAHVVYPYRVRYFGHEIEQIDGAVHAMGRSFLIEAKDHSTALNIHPIANLRNQLLRRPSGTMGVVFARCGFTDTAKFLANHTAPQTVLLWDGAELEFALKNRKIVPYLELKVREAAERGLSTYDITETHET